MKTLFAFLVAAFLVAPLHASSLGESMSAEDCLTINHSARNAEDVGSYTEGTQRPTEDTSAQDV